MLCTNFPQFLKNFSLEFQYKFRSVGRRTGKDGYVGDGSDKVVRIFTDEKLPLNSNTNFWEFDWNTHEFVGKTHEFGYNFSWSTHELTHELTREFT